MNKDAKRVNIDIVEVRETIRFLNDSEKYELLKMRFYSGMGFIDIANKVGTSKQAVAQKISSTIKHLYANTKEVFEGLEDYLSNEKFIFINAGKRQGWIITEIINYMLKLKHKEYAYDAKLECIYNKKWKEQAHDALVQKCFNNGLPLKLETLEEECVAALHPERFIVDEQSVYGLTKLQNAKKDVFVNFMLYARKKERFLKDEFESEFKVYLKYFPILPKSIFDKLKYTVTVELKCFMHPDVFLQKIKEDGVDTDEFINLLHEVAREHEQDESLSILYNNVSKKYSDIFNQSELINMYSFGSMLRLHTELNVNLVRELVSFEKIKLDSIKKDIVRKIVADKNTTDVQLIEYVASKEYKVNIGADTIYRAIREIN